MLERYFVKPATVDRIRASWIGGAIEQYIGWLSEQGYAARNVFRRVPILVQFGAFAAERGARRLDELPGYIDGFVAEWLRVHSGKSGPDACRKIASAARSPIEQMLRIALPDIPAANHRPHVLRHTRMARPRQPRHDQSLCRDQHALEGGSAGGLRSPCGSFGGVSPKTSMAGRRCIAELAHFALKIMWPRAPSNPRDCGSTRRSAT